MSGVVGASSRFSQVGGLLLITGVGVGDQGRYLCFVNNSIGQDTVEVTLRVTGKLCCFMTVFICLATEILVIFVVDNKTGQSIGEFTLETQWFSGKLCCFMAVFRSSATKFYS